MRHLSAKQITDCKKIYTAGGGREKQGLYSPALMLSEYYEKICREQEVIFLFSSRIFPGEIAFTEAPGFIVADELKCFKAINWLPVARSENLTKTLATAIFFRGMVTFLAKSRGAFFLRGFTLQSRSS